MKICTLLITALSLSLTAFANFQEDWSKTSEELAQVGAEFSAKERQLRQAGEGSPELNEKARDAFIKFLGAMDEHTDLKSYADKLKTLETELAAAIQEGDDNNRESAVMAMQKLKGEQMQAALKIPELLKLKETADTATQKAQQALVKSDPEAQALLAKRQKLLDRLTELSAMSE